MLDHTAPTLVVRPSRSSWGLVLGCSLLGAGLLTWVLGRLDDSAFGRIQLDLGRYFGLPILVLGGLRATGVLLRRTPSLVLDGEGLRCCGPWWPLRAGSWSLRSDEVGAVLLARSRNMAQVCLVPHADLSGVRARLERLRVPRAPEVEGFRPRLRYRVGELWIDRPAPELAEELAGRLGVALLEPGFQERHVDEGRRAAA